uniref:Uncharacterized protein n=1 Tax=Arundo donax TaxID=35708 RepID=A0A0A9HFE5_ARUDO
MTRKLVHATDPTRCYMNSSAIYLLLACFQISKRIHVFM